MSSWPVIYWFVTHTCQSSHTHICVCHSSHPHTLVHMCCVWVREPLYISSWLTYATHLPRTNAACHIHMHDSCHTYDWVMSHRRMRRVTHMIESCHTESKRRHGTRTGCARGVPENECIVSHICLNHVAQMNESCRTYEWVMLHILIINCHTYEGVMSHRK